MPPRLRQHALARVDQDDGKIRGRSAGDHVAGILLMARRIGDDEFAPVSREKPIGDIDGNALLAFRRQPIDQQREIDRLALRADPLAVRLKLRQLVFENHFRIIEQPADQRGLAVIDRAAGDEPQQRFMLMLEEIRIDILGNEVLRFVAAIAGNHVRHQKYPSCFFFSMLAAWSWSIARPWRSEVVVSSIS